MCQINLDSRCRFILDYILKIDGYVRIEDIAKTMNVSKRSIYYDISKINNWLSLNGIPELQAERQKGLIIEPSLKQIIKNKYSGSSKTASTYYIFSPEERTAAIICTIAASTQPVFLEKLSDMCMVSRNTTLNDLKTVKEDLAKYNLGLNFEVKSGYQITGSIIRKRAVFLYYLSRAAYLVNNRLLGFINYESIAGNVERFTLIEEELETEYVEGTLFQLGLLLSVVMAKKEKVEIDTTEESVITKRKEYQLICKYFPELDHNEKLYFSIHLLGSRVQVNQRFISKYRGKHNLYNLAAKMVQEFEQYACIEFNDKEELENKLGRHLGISLYRYRYGIVEGNPLAREIQNSYPELYQITRKVADSLSKTVGYPITDSEAAYLTLHFGSHLRTAGNKKGMVRVLLVCPSGISTANMLKKELEELLPIIEIIDIVSLKELKKNTKIYDLIVSTVEISERRHAITVHPVLTAIDKQNIISQIFKVKGINLNKGETDKVFGIIRKFIPEDCHTPAYEALKEYFTNKCTVFQDFIEKEAPGLQELLTPDRIQVREEGMDWKDAVALAATPLVSRKTIARDYINAMIKSVEDFGPYIFITPGVALAHAKPDEGVIDLSVAVLILKGGAEFMGGQIARIIIVLAPSDNESHLKALKDVVNIFSEESNVERLVRAQDAHEAHRTIGAMLQNLTK